MNTVICAAYQSLDLTKMTYESFLLRSKVDSRLILIDNGSTDGTKAWISELLCSPGGFFNCETAGGLVTGTPAVKNDKGESIPGRVTLVRSPVNGGCGIGRNIGARMVESTDYVTFIDNDVVLTDGWDEEMMLFMDNHPEVGICGPMTNFAGTPQLLDKNKWMLPQKVEDIEPFAQAFRGKNIGKWSYVPNGFVIVGFCMMIRKKCFDDLRLPDKGLFDERFKYYGNEDNDLCKRAVQAGWRLAYFGGCYVHHWGSKSLEALAKAGIDWGKHWNENKKAFEEKWGGKR